jgi:hypothetical protein
MSTEIKLIVKNPNRAKNLRFVSDRLRTIGRINTYKLDFPEFTPTIRM